MWTPCMKREIVSGYHLYRILGDTPRVAAGFLKFNVKFENRKIKMIAWQHSQKKSMENLNRWP